MAFGLVAREIVFRLSAAVLLVGVGFLSFLSGLLMKERSAQLFSILHSFSSGVMLGMGFVCLPLESVIAAKTSMQFSLFLSSSSFIILGAVYILISSASSDYRALSSVDLESFSGADYEEHGMKAGGDDESVVEMSAIEKRDVETAIRQSSLMVTVVRNDGSIIDDDGNERKIDDEAGKEQDGNNADEIEMYDGIAVFDPSSSSLSAATISVSAMLRNGSVLSAIVVVVFAALYVFLLAVSLGSVEHKEYSSLIRLISYQILVSCTLGTLLESLHAPESAVHSLIIMFIAASPVGLIVGGYAVHAASAASAIVVIHDLIGVVGSITAGVFVNITALHMIPKEMEAFKEHEMGETIEASTVLGQQLSDRLRGVVGEGSSIRTVKVTMLIVGYAFATAPCFLLHWID